MKPELEDLSHLNPPSTRRSQDGLKRAQASLSPTAKALQRARNGRAGARNKGKRKMQYDKP